MISQFIKALRNLQLEPTDEDVADILWLALQIGPTPDASDTPDRPTPPGGSNKPVLRDRSTTASPIQESTTSEKKGKLYPGSRAGVDESEIPGMLPFRAPAASALPGTLALGRALRPLMRKVASHTRFVIDEAQTAQRIAEEGLWLPVMNPAQERWLEVALVVDESRSMAIWWHTIAELQLLLERHGAFRDVRLWSLITDENSQNARLRMGIGRSALGQPISTPNELLDPSGRRLILVISDCVKQAWYNGTIVDVLTEWARRSPVALLQVLPRALWMMSALGDAEAARLRAKVPGQPNTQLAYYLVNDWIEREEASNWLLLPTVTLEPGPLKDWARALTSAEDAWAYGYVLDTQTGGMDVFENEDEKGQEVPLNAEERLKRFLATASPTARKLAGLLAATPITLPIVRLIQQTMLPKSQLSHVAEVFLGGLLEQLPGQRATDADEIQYDFIPGIRELLLDSQPTNESAQVLRNVSAFIEDRLGQFLDFRALLADPSVSSSIESFSGDTVRYIQPFALVGAKVLRRLGGRYAEAADQLEQRVDASLLAASPSVDKEDQLSDVDLAPDDRGSLQLTSSSKDAYSSKDRVALLEEAASRLDVPREEVEAPISSLSQTPVGELIRDFISDRVEFGFPVVSKITDRDFLTNSLKVPFKFEQLSQAYNFYWLYFPIILFSKQNWGFNRLEIRIEFNPDQANQILRPTVYQIFPAKEFQTLIEMSSHLQIFFDENFEFKASVVPINQERGLNLSEDNLDPNVDEKRAGELGKVVGPFQYHTKRAKIEHSGLGTEKIFWRIDEAESLQDGALSFIVIAQIPKETKELKVAARMQAYRRFDIAGAKLQQAVKELPQILRGFFTRGTPISSETTWGLTPMLLGPSSDTVKAADQTAPQTRNKVFISYSHKDKSWLDRLLIHLKPLESQGIIELWDDTKILPGAPVQEEIIKAIAMARVAILLVSADFLASDFIRQYELPTLSARARAGDTTIIPVILGPSTFDRTDLSTFQLINTPNNPLSSMSRARQEDILTRLAQVVMDLLKTEAEQSYRASVQKPSFLPGDYRIVWIHGSGSYQPGYSMSWQAELNRYLSLPYDDYVEVLWSTALNEAAQSSQTGMQRTEESTANERAIISGMLTELATSLQKLVFADLQSPTEQTQLPSRIVNLESYIGGFVQYLANRQVRDAVKERVKEQLRLLVGPLYEISIVAHSWGTVVAYESLLDLEIELPDFRVANFFTLGSPLWLVQPYLDDGSGRKPENIEKWTNITEQDSVLGSSLRPSFQVDQDFTVPNFGDGNSQESYFEANNVAVLRDIIAASISPIVKSDAPTITGISPYNGPSPGGTSIAITGTGFTGAIDVHFGTTHASFFIVNSDTQIVTVSPPGIATSTVDITVTTPKGTSATSAAAQFTYI